MSSKDPNPGDYGWDYMTADTDARPFVCSHDREVVVLDLDSGRSSGKIPAVTFHGSPSRKSSAAAFMSASDPGSVTSST